MRKTNFSAFGSNLKVVKTNKKPNLAQKMQNKADIERIDKVASESRLIRQYVPKAALKQTLDFFATVKEIDILKVENRTKYKDKALVLIETKQAVHESSFKIGEIMQDAAIRAKGYIGMLEAKKLKAKDLEPFTLSFPKEIGLEMYESLKHRFNILGKTASIDGATIRIDFDISDCQGKTDLAKRLAAIYDAADTIRCGLRQKTNHAVLMDMFHELSKVGLIEKNVNQFEYITGKELIEKGIANVIDSRSKSASAFQRFLNWITGKRDFVYLYCGHHVNPEKQYVIYKETELQNPIAVNHDHELRIRFDFGEQIYQGYGLKLAEQYYKEIIGIHNERIDQMNAQNAETNE